MIISLGKPRPIRTSSSGVDPGICRGLTYVQRADITFIRSTESLRRPIAVSWRPLLCVVRRAFSQDLLSNLNQIWFVASEGQGDKKL